jgi:hypothetical protein
VGEIPDPASGVAHEAASDARRLVLAHVDASEVGVDAVFMAGLDPVLRRSREDLDPTRGGDPDEGPDGYLAHLLAALTYLVRALALQAAPLDPETNLRRLLADFEERGTTF